MLIETLADLERWLEKEGLALRVGSALTDTLTWCAWLTRNRGFANRGLAARDEARGFGPTVAAAIASAIADYESELKSSDRGIWLREIGSKRGGQK